MLISFGDTADLIEHMGEDKNILIRFIHMTFLSLTKDYLQRVMLLLSKS